jgi:hypothetical protein
MAVIHRHHINMYLRDLKLSKQTRWSDFKERRKEIIEKYLVVKRRSMAMSIVVRQAGIYQCLVKCKEAIAKEKKNRKFKMQCARVALLLFIRMGKPMRKHGGYFNCMENKVRDCFTFTSLFMKSRFEEIATH